MLRSTGIILLIILSFSSCKKEGPETEGRVVYKVIPSSSVGAKPDFSVVFSSSKTSSATRGGLSQTFKSDTYYFIRGDFVSMTVEGKSSGVSYTLQIFMNGILWQQKAMGAYGPATLEGNLPE